MCVCEREKREERARHWCCTLFSSGTLYMLSGKLTLCFEMKESQGIETRREKTKTKQCGWFELLIGLIGGRLILSYHNDKDEID